jgi:hypothetical protein
VDEPLTYTLTTVVALFAVLQIKHFICDYPLQTRYHLENKGTYGHPGGVLHSGIHVLGTALVFLIVTPTLAIGALILVGEFLIHYHTDWGKAQIMKSTDWTAKDAYFWWAIGADQLVHHLTYLTIVVLLLG